MSHTKSDNKKKRDGKDAALSRLEAMDRARRVLIREMMDPYWSWRFARANGA